MTLNPEQQVELARRAAPLVNWLRANAHPHCRVTVDQTSCELSEGIAASYWAPDPDFAADVPPPRAESALATLGRELSEARAKLAVAAIQARAEAALRRELAQAHLKLADAAILRRELVATREKLAAAYVELSGKTAHASTCATSVAPGGCPGPCDCDSI